MQFCTSLQITTPAPHHSEFLQAGCRSCHPTNSVKALKAELKGHRYFFSDDGMWIMPDMLCMKFPFFYTGGQIRQIVEDKASSYEKWKVKSHPLCPGDTRAMIRII